MSVQVVSCCVYTMPKLLMHCMATYVLTIEPIQLSLMFLSFAVFTTHLSSFPCDPHVVQMLPGLIFESVLVALPVGHARLADLHLEGQVHQIENLKVHEFD